MISLQSRRCPEEALPTNGYVLGGRTYPLPPRDVIPPEDSAINRLSNVFVNDGHGPRLLDILAQYEAEELRRVNAAGEPFGEPKRLAVYRRMFDVIIAEFRTYGPIMGRIKKEYESSIAMLKAIADQIYPLREDLAILRHQADCNLAQTTCDMRRQLEDLRKENDFKLETAEQHQKLITALREQNLATQEELKRVRASGYHEGEDARISSLQAEYEEKFEKYRRLLTEKEANILELSDEIIKLERAVAEHEEEKKAYLNVVPREQLDAATEEVALLAKQVNEVNSRYDGMEMEFKFLQDTHKKTLADRSVLENRLMTEKYPDWDYVRTRCKADDISSYEQSAKGMDSMDTIAYLVHEIIKVKKQSNFVVTDEKPDDVFVETPGEAEFFLGLGTGTDVPKYLRYKGRIPNRKLSKRNTCMLIHDIWTAKALFDSDPRHKARPLSLAEFFFQYLKKRFAKQDVIVQWGYNIYEACRKFRLVNVQCRLFLDVLNGTTEEETYRHLRDMNERLKNFMHKQDVTLNGGKPKGTLLKAAVIDAVKKFWGNKPRPVSCDVLQSSLDSDQPGAAVTYKWIFQHAETSLFIDVINAAELAAMDKLLEKLSDYLAESYGLSRELSAADCTQALSRLDAKRKKAELNHYVARGFGVSRVENIKVGQTVEIDRFVANLRRGVFV